MVCMLGMIFYYFAKTRKKKGLFLLFYPSLSLLFYLQMVEQVQLVLFLMSILSIPLLVSKYQNLINFSFIALLSILNNRIIRYK